MRNDRAEYFRNNLNRQIRRFYQTDKDFIKCTEGLEPRTFYRKIKDPAKITLSEVYIWSQALHMKPSDFTDMYHKGKLWKPK